MPDEQWGEVGDCDQCRKKGIPVDLLENPYTKEMFPEDDNEPEYWCENCYDESSGAI